MESSEIRTELSLSYDELTKYLIEKYGPAKVDYFCTPSCRSRNNAVSRTKDGLLCHHIDEDKGGNLSNPTSAAAQPYEWQKKERLVYCNYIEHLILHIKIAILRQKAPLRTPWDVYEFFSTGGIYMVCSDLNDLFTYKGGTANWQKRCYVEVEENLSDYVMLIKLLLRYIDQQYIGTKDSDSFLRIGGKLKFADCVGTVIHLDEEKKKIRVKIPLGKENSFSWQLFLHQATYDDMMYHITLELADGYNTLHYWIYDYFKETLDENTATELIPLLQIDYHGFGFPQFSYDFIDQGTYGSSSVDEYVSKAFPAFSIPSYTISDVTPIFWTGGIPRRVSAKRCFYIVRVSAVFKVKEGKVPFVQYKNSTPLHMSDVSFGSLSRNFLTFRDGRTVSDSFMYDKQNNKFYSAYYDLSGKLIDSELVVSMTKEDYVLFKKEYHVLKCTVLDGCYFEV